MVPGPGGFLFRASDKFEKGFRFSQVLMLSFDKSFLGALKVPSGTAPGKTLSQNSAEVIDTRKGERESASIQR